MSQSEAHNAEQSDIRLTDADAGTERSNRLRRSQGDQVLAGVCGGLGAAFDVDPLWFRLAFVVLTIGGGSGIAIYIILWLIMPEETTDNPVGVHPALEGSEGPVVGGIALVAVGALLLANSLIPWFDRIALPLAVIVAGIGLVFVGGKRVQH